ncbi:hypothetical protein JVU11DRAFT_8107 [Chiua virens]|nr:hypothetical protein JVU11DRAFT_8107 [Chiua virens]
MFDVHHFFVSLLGLVFFQNAEWGLPRHQLEVAHASKSVGIVGAGSAGLAMLCALVNLEDELYGNLDIVGVRATPRRRRDLVGPSLHPLACATVPDPLTWSHRLPDPQPIHSPTLPETPLYPNLHTNVPVPRMSFPGVPFPPGTPLFARHDYVERYHQDFAQTYNLMPYILLNHTVLSGVVGRFAAGGALGYRRDGPRRP